MLFSSIVFLFTFLPVTLLVYYLVPGRLKNIVLLLASLVFYAWGEPVYVILMVLSILFNYVSGIDIERNLENPFKAKQSLVIAVAVNLLILGFFKYYGFLIESLNAVLPVELPYKELALPIGISFYTFQTLSYIIDVYRGKVQVQKNLISFGVYVTMFPQLIAGPIVKYSDVEMQLRDRNITMEKFGDGAIYFVRGLAKKVLIANMTGLVFTKVSAITFSEMSVLTAWIGCIAYTFQIYFDFSGYSDMAVGLGKMLGFEFMKNFDYPYLSKSITEFWRRWHISLGTWFRDYVYIPMGGNQVGKARWFFNIFTVWMLTGFWHGAAWNFVLWGLFFALLLVCEKLWLLPHLARHKFISHVYVLFFVAISFVLFHAENLPQACSHIGGMFGIGGIPLASPEAIYYLKSFGFLLLIAVIGATPVCKYLWTVLEMRLAKNKGFAIVLAIAEPCGLLLLLLVMTAFLVDGSFNPFLYFRF